MAKSVIPKRARGPMAAVAAVAIPYRLAPAVSVGSMASAVLLTVILLGALVIGLLVARRYGWLRPWLGIQAPRQQESADLRVVARARLSPTTRAFVVEWQEAKYLVLESSQHLVLQQQPLTKGGDGCAQDA